METTQTDINFTEQREFGDVFNATFAFIKQNFRPLGTALLYFAGPFILFSAIVSAFLQTNTFGNLLGNVNSNPDYFFPDFMGRFFLFSVLIMVFTLISYTVISAVTYGYISLYIEKGKDNIKLSDIWGQVKIFFFPIIGTNIVCGLIIGVGTTCLVLPGIYLGVSLSLIIIILIYEKQGFGHAFSKSFNLTHTKWFWTLLILLVIYVIIGLISYLFGFLQMFAMLGSIFNTVSDGENSMGLSSLYIIISIITTFISTMLYVVPKIAISFHYFSLNESKYKPTLLQKIEEINIDENQSFE